MKLPADCDWDEKVGKDMKGMAVLVDSSSETALQTFFRKYLPERSGVSICLHEPSYK